MSQDSGNLKHSLKAIFKETLEKRKQKNARYSLRALARDLEISPSTVSKIINDKYSLSEKMLLDIVVKLDIHTDDRKRVFFFERCRNFLVFLKQQNKKSPEDLIQNQKSYEYKAIIKIDNIICPDSLFYLKAINENFLNALESLSTIKDTRIQIDNTLSIQEISAQ
ncbi:MAG: helix-turn-helix transcriptional regulator [Bdellovibrionaceae bacterium]|nr:helix-turn-helix transcriptional regulator [Pseudobdellovibrionaceae bacterium]